MQSVWGGERVVGTCMEELQNMDGGGGGSWQECYNKILGMGGEGEMSE